MEYFLTVTRDMPSSLAMARRDGPWFFACCTASQRAY